MVGFFIGLVTNGLAIFMLFHPYEKKKFLGIRIPFTPGAIPREHKRLAHKIAEAVCDHLLTNEEILDGFEKEDVKNSLFQSINLGVDSVLNTEFESINSMIPKEWDDDFNSLLEHYLKKISDEINNVLDREDTVDVVRHFVDQEINKLLEIRLDSVIDKKHVSKLESIIKRVVTKVYKSTGIKDRAYSILNTKLDDFIFSSKKVKEVLSPEMLDVIEKNVVQQTEDLTKALFLRMKKEDTLRGMESEIKSKAKTHIKNVKFIPRIILEMPITNHKIDTFLEQFMADLRGKDQLNKIDKIVIKKLMGIMSGKVRDIFEKEVKEVILEVPSDTISHIKIEIEQKLYEIFTDKELEALLIGELDKGIINFEELEMQKLIPELTEHELSKVKGFISETIIGGMKKKDIRDRISLRISDILKGYLDKKVGNLSHVLSHSFVEKVKNSIFDKSFSVIREQAPTLLRQIDIKAMVEKKVEEFPLVELEKIIIQIAGTQLKNITLLGGILGFVIGLFQVLINP
jgi:uncharacterized membrane protein YheB (UPF0754 family)